MSQAFQIRVPAKWILSGEHSVLRGGMAIALAHPEFGITLSFSPDRENQIRVEPKSSEPLILELLESLKDRWAEEDRSFPRISGVLKLESTIPQGAGLGSSAALCVALTRWLSPLLQISEKDQTEFATSLEHRFHGRSSGMDVAAVFANEPISFFMSQGARSLGIKNIPTFKFHDTGLRARTSDCVIKVEKFREENPNFALQIDESMGLASREALDGLFKFNLGQKDDALKLIAQAMNRAQECFYSWQLVPSAAQHLQQNLIKEGALAVKLTGAGGGGMLVSLWN
jgi:mevalonate kinase